MGILFVVCGIAVVLVLTLAGVSKFGRAAETAGAMREFGLPARWADRAAPVLPAAELGIAVCLLTPGVAWAGALAATLFMALVTMLVTVALLQNRHPSCNCFGQVRAAPVSWGVALRSLLLTLCAAYVLWTGPAQLDQGLLAAAGKLAATPGAAVLASLAVACLFLLQGWLSLNLVRQQGRLLLKIDNLEQRLAAAGIPEHQFAPLTGPLPGSAAPAFSAVTLAGAAVSSSTLFGNGTPSLLLFVSADCAPCQDLLADLLAWRGAHPPRDRLVIVTSGTAQANRDKLGGLIGADALLQEEREINALFGVVATPSALLLGADGSIAAPIAIGKDQIMALVQGTRARDGAGLPGRHIAYS
ncbi:hypothetical protein RBA41_09360 [Massilia sp. CCM 9210]|uniref:MauE/DoxX family redox-associated membrane protein n=1 Tax=Massilia scottii TaxID=3057166 RepID=UPI0027969716|nr:MauE/DoxX family redox-associated membrane protein [Massilia sp. CCM 9210]MDQ1813510.1 hypothetical protein [Massilia sp. CCM 9210]